MKKWKKLNISFKTYLFIALIAEELLLSFTFLGYLHLPPISVTFAYLPVVVAACFLNTAQSAVLGLVFGLASMFKASSNYVMPADSIFSPFQSSSPLSSLILSIGTRMLFAVLVHLMFQLVRKKMKDGVSMRIALGLVAALAPRLHAALVYAAIALFFPDISATLGTQPSLNDLLGSLLSVCILEGAWIISRHPAVRNFCFYVEQSDIHSYSRKGILTASAVVLILASYATLSSASYFSHRMIYMLEQHGYTISDAAKSDLMFLQIQFLIAAFSLFFLLVLGLILTSKYLIYREYLGELDGLTGVMGRRMFLTYCSKLQKTASLSGINGWFLFIDVDHFKSINDTFGHPVGDSVLKGIADCLTISFQNCGSIGRIGGDEFAVITEEVLSEAELKALLDTFAVSISGLLPAPHQTTCSIGVYGFPYPENLQTIYSKADQALYAAKQAGRARYVIEKTSK